MRNDLWRLEDIKKIRQEDVDVHLHRVMEVEQILNLHVEEIDREKVATELSGKKVCLFVN